MNNGDKDSYFDRVAGDWDRMREVFFSESLREAALAEADLKPGMRAADLGAGTGFITEGLVRAGLEVIAVDQSEAMLEELQKKFPCQHNPDCRAGGGENIPIQDGIMDFAFANMFLHHTDDPAAAILEMTRILKRGGRLVITDLTEHAYTFLKEEHHDRWMGFSEKSMKAWFTTAGLDKIHYRVMGEDCCSESCESSQKAEVAIFLAAGTKA